MANFNFNKVILGGRLTAEPELKQTQSGIPVCPFSIAVTRKGKSAEKTTDFINCRAWQQTAEFVSRYFHKGSSISVVGKLQQNNWTDQQGTKHNTYEVVVDEINFVDSAKESAAPIEGIPAEQTSYNPYTSKEQPADENVFSGDDDLPF
ncbi:MAG: single-stranded DNA-binding protein [Clostridia bacterium]|nr:single-stranded DNA-binding protein [Clostridia bacterium]